MWPRPTSNCAALTRRFDAQLEITRSTIKARQDSLQLTQSLEKYGAGSLADTRQAEELLYGAKANQPGHPPLCHPEELTCLGQVKGAMNGC